MLSADALSARDGGASFNTDLDAPRANVAPAAGVQMTNVGAQMGAAAGLEKAAEDFEALFLQQVLKQMRKASEALSGDTSLSSREQSTLRDFYDEALATHLSRSGQTGIKHLLMTQLAGRAPDLSAAGAAAQAAAIPAAVPTSAAAPTVASATLYQSQARPSLAADNSFLQLYRSAVPATGRNDLLAELGAFGQRAKNALSLAGNRFGEALGKQDFAQLVKRVIRQESAGQVDAVSPKGARGLMQLMPSTAREMAAELGLPYSAERLTTDARYNLTLGSAYLEKMLKRFDQSTPLALAAYNAGPGRVEQWLAAFGDPRLGQISEREWMRAIPISETRAYTQSILRDFSVVPRPGAFK